MKKLFVFVSLFTCFSLMFCIISPTVEASESISKKVLRIHILANSDSEEDQMLKLKVKDSVINISEKIFSDCNSLNEAIVSAQDNVDSIEKTAKRIIVENGYNYSVKTEITKEYFSTRKYESFTLPAGVYNSIKIVIGNGEGHNWWCVMFPQVCLSGCTDDFDDYLSTEEKELITSGGFSVKFKIIEIYERIKDKLF